MQYTHIRDPMYFAQPTILVPGFDEVMMQIAIQYFNCLKSKCYALKSEKQYKIAQIKFFGTIEKRKTCMQSASKRQEQHKHNSKARFTIRS